MTSCVGTLENVKNEGIIEGIIDLLTQQIRQQLSKLTP